MKTVMKKLFSLMLVAVLLVSAMPFQAFADEAVCSMCGQTGHVVEEHCTSCGGVGHRAGDHCSICNDITHADVDHCTSCLSIEHDAKDHCSICNDIHAASEHCTSCLSLEHDAEDHCSICNDIHAASAHCSICNDLHAVAEHCTSCGALGHDAEDHCTVCNKLPDECSVTCPGNPAYEEPKEEPVKKPVSVTFCGEDGANVWKYSPYSWDLSGDSTDAETLLYYAQKNLDLDKDYIFGENKDGESVWRKKDGASTGGYIGTGAAINPGDTVRIVVKLKDQKPDPKPTEPKPENPTKPAKMHDIWLYIYTNDNVTTPAKRVRLSEYKRLVSDGEVTKHEVLSVIDDYFLAENPRRGFYWEGMYLSTAIRLDKDSSYNRKYYKLDDELDGLNELREKQLVIIKAHVSDVAVKSTTSSSVTGTADSSNPKTGDMIFAPVMVLGASASALAVLFFLNKKRAL